MDKIITLLLISILVLCGCGKNDAIVTHHLLNCSEKEETIDTTSLKSLTKFVDLYPKSSKSEAEILSSLLDDDSIESMDYDSIDIEVGVLSINNITPQYNKLNFSVMTTCDTSSLRLYFKFDTGDIESVTLDAVPSGILISTSIDLPEKAKKVKLLDFTYTPATIIIEKTYEIDECNEFKHLSNNTIRFSCDAGRYLVTTQYGKILDDLELSGKGSVVTANGATNIVKIKIQGK